MLRPVLIATNDPEEGGTTTLSDGSKWYWNEGRSSWVYGITATGARVEFRAGDPACPLNAEREDGDGRVDEPDEETAVRSATECERHEWTIERDRGNRS